MELVKKQDAAPAQFDRRHIDLIKEMYFKGSSDEEFQMFIHVCQKTGLDPAMRQIHPVKRWDSKMKKEVMTVQTGIDGYRLIAERTGRYAPGREPTYEYDKEGKLRSATAYVKKQTADGTWHEIAASAFYEEYVQRTKEGTPTNFWTRMAHNQLAKCAEALALRKAFPGDLSGIYTHEEMEQADRPGVSATAKITQQQAQELEEVFGECDPTYVERIWSALKKQNIGGLSQLTPELYERIKAAAMRNAEEFRISQAKALEDYEVIEDEDALDVAV